MTRKLSLPDTASVAETGPDGRMYAPSATRNMDAIAAVLDTHAPPSGHALEIASGTGQHIAQLAASRSRRSK